MSRFRSTGMARLSLIVLVVGSLAGCIEVPEADHRIDPGDGSFTEPVYLLDYTLEDLSGESRRPAEERHCPTAWREGDEIQVQQYEYDRVRDATAHLLVDPTWKGAWMTFGSESYLTTLPTTIRSDDASIDEPFLSIGARDGRITVDGEPVSLPHTWQRTAEDGSWRISAHLRDGPDHIRAVEDQMCM